MSSVALFVFGLAIFGFTFSGVTMYAIAKRKEQEDFNTNYQNWGS